MLAPERVSVPEPVLRRFVVPDVVEMMPEIVVWPVPVAVSVCVLAMFCARLPEMVRPVAAVELLVIVSESRKRLFTEITCEPSSLTLIWAEPVPAPTASKVSVLVPLTV